MLQNPNSHNRKCQVRIQDITRLEHQRRWRAQGWVLGRDDFHFLSPSLFGLENMVMCYREKHVGLHGGSWWMVMPYTPHGTTLCGEKSLIIVKNYSGKKRKFLSSVTLTKSMKYIWNSFGQTKGLPGTQEGGEKLILALLSISHPFWVSWSPLARPKTFQKYCLLLVSITEDRKLVYFFEISFDRH